MAAAPSAIHAVASVTAKLRIAIILTSALRAASDPPPDLARRAAEREAASEAARGHYTYRQSVLIEEMSSSGRKTGEYRETRDIIFSPGGARTEVLAGKPWMGLERLRLTDEDFRDLREVQPMLLTPDRLWIYETRYRGEESIDGLDCWVVAIRPRQILDGQRLFEGLLWIDKRSFGVARLEGRAVPQHLSARNENLFPRFTTIREQVDGKHWFPLHTHADDVLPFRGGPLRMRLSIRYSNYRRFGAESSITFEPPKP